MDENSKESIQAVQINQMLDEAVKRIQTTFIHPEGLCGIASGFHGLDKITSGWQHSNLIIIATHSAMYKTDFTVALVRNLVVNNAKPTALFSFDRSGVSIPNQPYTKKSKADFR